MIDDVVHERLAAVRRGPRRPTPLYIPSKTGNGDVVLVNVYPDSAPQDAATTDLVNHLRNDIIPQAVGNSGVNVLVGGTTAIYIDFANVLSAKLPLFIGLVVLLSFLLLMTVFRSFVIPLTAAVHEPALHRGSASASSWPCSSGATWAHSSASTAPARSRPSSP